MPTNDEHSWSREDAWVLTAVALAGGRGADLTSVIAGADACNHDIPSAAALARGLGRLAASGLVHLDPGLHASLSKEGRRVTRQAKGGTVRRLLAMPASLAPVPLREGFVGLPDEEYEQALQRYYDRRG